MRVSGLCVCVTTGEDCKNHADAMESIFRLCKIKGVKDQVQSSDFWAAVQIEPRLELGRQKVESYRYRISFCRVGRLHMCLCLSPYRAK